MCVCVCVCVFVKGGESKILDGIGMLLLFFCFCLLLSVILNCCTFANVIIMRFLYIAVMLLELCLYFTGQAHINELY